ncbi:MAG: T9SS type A sorting domain-containing protein [Ignavibacteria bacterium]|nr:T9SS type A sorting domain-containing protein [Ignavibacteria bacterium]
MNQFSTKQLIRHLFIVAGFVLFIQEVLAQPTSPPARIRVVASAPADSEPGGRVFFRPQGFPDTTCPPDFPERRIYCRVYPSGDTVHLLAVPDSGFRFAGWSGGGTLGEHQRELTIVARDSMSIHAWFVSTDIDSARLRMLRVSYLRHAGVVRFDPHGFPVECRNFPETKVRCFLYVRGTEVTMKAKPFDDYFFVGWWLRDTLITDSVLTLTIVDTLTNVFAQFELDSSAIPVPTKFRTFTQRQLSKEKIKPGKGKNLMPDSADARDSVFMREFGRATLVLGVPQLAKDSIKRYGWIVFKKPKDVQKFFVQTGTAYFFDSIRTSGRGSKLFTKAMVNPKPPTYNNHLAGELAALKLNIAASKHKITRTGFGSLIYADSTSMFDEKSLVEICKFSDSAMTYWRRYNNLISPKALDSVLTLINKAFYGPIDSVDILYKRPLRIEGEIELDSVPFLQTPDTIDGKFFAEDGDANWMIPEQFSLSQNYPNPFNPSTTIRFQLSAFSNISLKIYNALGEEVATLLHNEEMEEGAYELQFDAGNLPSSVYFYRINVTQDGTLRYTETKKMLLMK